MSIYLSIQTTIVITLNIKIMILYGHPAWKRKYWFIYKFVQVIPLENKQSMKTQRNLLLNCTRSAKWHDVWVSAKITRKIKAQFTIRFRLSATELGLAHMASSSIFQTSITNKLKTNQTPNETMIMTCPSIKNTLVRYSDVFLYMTREVLPLKLHKGIT